ncbi:hypothetical protein F2Q69_00036142 [Brassica cretica]|uniref:Uncharacterized protein n=1 Tax=Brassica cretica TaxID=69181 RepID=A0A8S9SUX3_BRACR|nr:hypothetical protein F2Q69_00036142 [Brassica cretica]
MKIFDTWLLEVQICSILFLIEVEDEKGRWPRRRCFGWSRFRRVRSSYLVKLYLSAPMLDGNESRNVLQARFRKLPQGSDSDYGFEARNDQTFDEASVQRRLARVFRE